MNELKKKVLEIITAINRDWSEAINKASTEDKGLDLSDMSVKFSEKIMLLEQAFIDGTERIAKKKGKKIW